MAPTQTSTIVGKLVKTDENGRAWTVNKTTFQVGDRTAPGIIRWIKKAHNSGHVVEVWIRNEDSILLGIKIKG